MTKRILMALALGALVSAPLLAQETQEQQQNGKSNQETWQRGRRGQMGQRRMEMLTRSLNLSSDQQAQVRKAFEDERQQLRTLRQDSSLSQQDFRAKAESLHLSTTAQIRASLNSDQQTKYDQMQQRMRSRGFGRRGPGNKTQPAPGTPS